MMKVKKIVALLMCLLMVFALAACGGDSNTGSTGSKADSKGSEASKSDASEASNVSTGEVRKIVFALPTVYDTPDGPEVQAAINAITEEKYGISFEIMYIAMGNWQQQSNLLMTGDEVDVIAIFGTPLNTYVNNGQLATLDEYYAGATEEFKSVWSDEELAGTSAKGNIYAIPNLRNFGNYFGLNIDEEVAAAMGIEDGQHLTLADVDELLYKIKEAYPDRYALAPSGDAILGQWTWDGLGDTKYLGVLPDRGQTLEVQNIFNTDDFLEVANYTRKWYQDGIFMQDVLSNTESWQSAILSKKAATVFDNYGVNGVAGMIRTVIIDAWSVSNSYTDLCYGINANSKDKDAAWQAMEILYTDREVGVLLNNGIEDKHYVKNDDGTISFPEGKTAGDVGYGMSDLYWVTPYSALSYPLDQNGPTFFEDLVKFNKEETTISKAFGFSFDNTPVVDQYTACANIFDKYFKAIISGTVDIESTIAQANQEFEAAGLQDIIDEKQRQLDEFLANQ